VLTRYLQRLTYYELDLGLNHVVRKWSEPTDARANLLVQVPGGQLATAEGTRFDGPSGVLVCCEDHIIYRHPDKPQHRVPIPRRDHPLADKDRGLIIVSAVMHKMKVSVFPRQPAVSVVLTPPRVNSSFYFKARKGISTK
jgi:splicing factor 3B subunit 3